MWVSALNLVLRDRKMINLKGDSDELVRLQYLRNLSFWYSLNEHMIHSHTAQEEHREKNEKNASWKKFPGGAVFLHCGISRPDTKSE